MALTAEAEVIDMFMNAKHVVTNMSYFGGHKSQTIPYTITHW